VPTAIVKDLVSALGPERVVTSGDLLDQRRHDYWVRSHLDDLQGRPAPRPACVVRPLHVEEVVAVVNICRLRGAPLISFGLGSGVCGGVLAREDAILLDLGAMDRVRSIDETNLLAEFDAGKNGLEAEKAVARRGLTIGHWPQSIAVSSVGGWIATRASGQFSTAYGNIEDIVYSIEAVLPSGDLVRLGRAPRAAAGPDLRHLLLGSEGTLGVITGVSFSLRRAPERSAHSAFFARTMAAGLDAQRRIVQAGWLPPVMRQYDSIEATRNFSESVRGEDALLFMVHEGPAGRVEAEVQGVEAIARKSGLDPAPVEVVRKWLDSRNHVPAWESFLKNGIILDTIEISAPWDKIAAIYDSVTASVKQVPGVLAATAHSSHVYRSGVNLYFTFAARPERREDMAAAYDECWRRAVETTAAQGGGIAHHHGIGRVRRNYLHHDLGPGGVTLLRTLKRALDPGGFMNPGVLIPDA
jgi:alkyldihydroxyacetonephosphate synthase